MPRARALRSTVEIPAWFSTLTAIASTPRVIQLSTTSFCFAASSPTGPSQIISTPAAFAASSAPTRQDTKYGSPLAFGITAITGRLPGDAGTIADDEPAAIDRNNHTLVPATISAPARIVPQRIASWDG